jgi:DNA-binding CsgD family transcriptional regulator
VIVSPERRLVPFPGGRAVLRPVGGVPEMERDLVSLPTSRGVGQGQTQLAELERATMEARQALEEAVVAATVAAQRAIEVAEALDETLAVLAAAESDSNHAPSPRGVPEIDLGALSSREREVLALVAEGRSNKAIAEVLFVSPNTVKTHVASLLSKLRAESRAQLAAIAARSAVVAEGAVAAR